MFISKELTGEEEKSDRILLVENIFKEVLKEKEKEMKRLGWVYEIVSEGFIFTEIKLECIPSLLGKPSKNIEEEFIQDL